MIWVLVSVLFYLCFMFVIFVIYIYDHNYVIKNKLIKLKIINEILQKNPIVEPQ